MTPRRRRLPGGSVFLTLFALLLGLAYWILGLLMGHVPPVLELYDANGCGIGFAAAVRAFDIPPAGQRLGDFTTIGAATALSPVTVSTPLRAAEAAYACAASAGYGKLLPLRYTQGCWFAPGDTTNARRYAVIPDDLSIRLFGSDRPGDATLEVDGEPVAVLGVYVSARNFLTQTGGDGRPVVYLSAPPNANADAPVCQILIDHPENLESRQLLFFAAEKAGTALYGTESDLRDIRALAAQLPLLAIVICAALPVFALIRAGLRQLMKLYLHRATYDGADFAAVLLRGAALTGGGLLAAGLCFGMLSPPIAYLPPDNLFDLPHYAGLATGFLQRLGAQGRTDSLMRMIAAGFVCLAALLPMAIGCWMGGFSLLLRHLRRGVTRRDG